MIHEEFLNNFTQYLSEDLKKSASTVGAYKSDLIQFLNYLESRGFLSYDDLNQETVKEYISFNKNAGKSQATILRYTASMNSFVNYLNKTSGMAKKEINFKALNVEKKETKYPQILSEAEINRILDKPQVKTPKGARDKAMMELLYGTGLRVSELLSLDVENINLSIGFIKYRRPECPVESERIIPITSNAAQALSNYALLARDLLIGTNETRALFVNVNGERMTRQGFWKIVKQYAKEARIDKEITPNTFRHSFAAHLLENGANLDALKSILGYSDISSTQVYAQMLKNKYSTLYSQYYQRAERK